MNARDALKLSIDMGKTVGLRYLDDLSDEEMMRRPCPGCNHINWQVGHLIAAEHQLIGKVAPQPMPPLPAGFAEKYTKETATSDDPGKFCTKAELLKAFEEQRAATLAALAKTSDADLDKPTGMDFFPTVGSLFELQGSHWLMHAGQWAVVRRQLGRKPIF
jgi:hypothetical protein